MFPSNELNHLARMWPRTGPTYASNDARNFPNLPQRDGIPQVPVYSQLRDSHCADGSCGFPFEHSAGGEGWAVDVSYTTPVHSTLAILLRVATRLALPGRVS